MQRFGVDGVLDRDGRRFRNKGLHLAQLPEPRWIERMVEDPTLVRMPLVRWKQKVTVGLAEAEWKEWVES